MDFEGFECVKINNFNWFQKNELEYYEDLSYDYAIKGDRKKVQECSNYIIINFMKLKVIIEYMEGNGKRLFLEKKKYLNNKSKMVMD